MDTDTPKLGWGGKRVNQNGRPPLPPEERRVRLNARVSPETKDWLDKQATPTGRIIDNMVRKEKN